MIDILKVYNRCSLITPSLKHFSLHNSLVNSPARLLYKFCHLNKKSDQATKFRDQLLNMYLVTEFTDWSLNMATKIRAQFAMLTNFGALGPFLVSVSHLLVTRAPFWLIFAQLFLTEWETCFKKSDVHQKSAMRMVTPAMFEAPKIIPPIFFLFSLYNL